MSTGIYTISPETDAFLENLHRANALKLEELDYVGFYHFRADADADANLFRLWVGELYQGDEEALKALDQDYPATAPIIMKYYYSIDDCTDAELIYMISRGLLKAMGVLFSRHYSAVYRIACAVLRDAVVAEDIVQEGFLRMHHYARRLELKMYEPLMPWLYRVTVNLCNTWILRQQREQALDGLEDNIAAPTDYDLEEIMIRSEASQEVQLALQMLSAAKRRLIVLYYLDGINANELALMFDIPVATVRSRLFYARKELRTALAAIQNSPANTDAYVVTLIGGILSRVPIHLYASVEQV